MLVDGATPLRPEPALFEAMLEGWRRQQAARRLSGPLIEGRVRLVRRFQAFTGAWPWQWTPEQVERVGRVGRLGAFDGPRRMRARWRSSWTMSAILGTAGSRSASSGSAPAPVQVCHEGNAAVHAADYEGRPERRPLTRAELQAFFDAADDHVEQAAGSRRKGWLTGVPGRDAVQGDLRVGAAAPGGGDAGRGRLRRQPGRCPSSAGWGCAMSGTARRCGAARRAAGRWPP